MAHEEVSGVGGPFPPTLRRDPEIDAAQIRILNPQTELNGAIHGEITDTVHPRA